jgi:hypothetical protein
MPRYYTGAYSSQENLMAAINTVLTDAAGLNWNQDELDNPNDEAGWNDGGSLYISADWDNSADINFYLATAWSGASTAPGAHTGDSGSALRVNAIGNGSGTYHAYTNNSVGPDYAYFVIEYDTGFYRHFGFGLADQIGAWVGPEFGYGHFWDQGGPIDEPNSSTHSIFLDGNTVQSSYGGVMRCADSLPNKPVSSVWGIAHNAGTIGNDTGGNGRYRLQGDCRRGPYCQNFAFIDPTSSSAYVPGSPIEVYAKDPNHSSPEHWMKLGQLPNIYLGSISGYTDEQEITFGSETWEIYPIINSTWSASSGLEQSGNGGVWYRKV